MALADINKLINITDPPKDLDEDGIEGERLTSLPDAKKTILAGYIRDVFYGEGDEDGFVGFLETSEYPGRFKPINSDKTFIVGKITALYNLYFGDTNKRLVINRVKKSDGADLRPSDLCVSYDAGVGPDKLIRNHILVVTPGTVLDPATKPQPRDTDIVYLPADGTTMELPMARITELSLQNIITGNIVIENEADEYEVRVPTNTLGVVSGTFANNYAVQDEAENVFAGNGRKNKYIYDKLFAAVAPTANEVTKMKQYLLAKELGDTLQVQWLNYILSENQRTSQGIPRKSNTVIATNDTIVWLRCIVNGIGVIFNQWNPTLREYESVYYLPNVVDAVQELLVKKSFIATIRDLVYSSNLSVIKQVDELIALITTAPPGRSLTTLDSEFNPANFPKLIALFQGLRDKLIMFNEDLKNELSILTDIDTAKRVARQGYIVLPFVKNKRGEFKKKISVSFLLPETRRFRVSIVRLTNENVSRASLASINQLLFTGGKRFKQKGGACSFQTYTQRKSRLETIINQPTHLVNAQTFRTALSQYETCRFERLEDSVYKTNLQDDNIVDAIVNYVENNALKQDADENILELPNLTDRAVVLNEYVDDDLYGEINPAEVDRNTREYALKLEDNDDNARGGRLNANNFLYILTRENFKELIFYGAIVKSAYDMFLYNNSYFTFFTYPFRSWPITSYYNLKQNNIRGTVYLANEMEYTKVQRRERLAFQTPFNVSLFNQTVELLAYAKYYCYDVNTRVRTAQIEGFYNALNAKDERFNLDEKYRRIQTYLVGVDVIQYEEQVGGETPSNSLKNKKIVPQLFDMFNEVCLELHDYYFDQEHYRCMSDTKDYSSFLNYKTSALEGVKLYLQQKDLNKYQYVKATFLEHVIQEDYNKAFQSIKFNFSKVPVAKPQKTKLTERVLETKPLTSLLELNEYPEEKRWRGNLERVPLVMARGGRKTRRHRKMRLKSQRRTYKERR